MPVDLARVLVPSIFVMGLAGVDGSTAAAPARARDAPGRLDTAAATDTSSIVPQALHSGQRPTHLGTAQPHEEQRKFVLIFATRSA